MIIDSDQKAYQAFPQHRKWFNKLWFSESMGYNCGPCGTSPNKSGVFVVRPAINLSGMSVGAKKITINPDELYKIPPGYFWCEYFHGTQYSITYQWRKDGWTPLSCWKGYKSDRNLTRFSKWERCQPQDCHYNLPTDFSQLSNVKKINVEFIEDKPIEVHLRTSPDPDYDILIPIWADENNSIDKYIEMGYKIISSYDDADGHLDVPRIAFAVKNRKD